jgi:DNA polymerase
MLAAVHAWRAANPRTVEFWRDCESAARTPIRTGTAQRIRCLTFEYRSGMLFIALPSGRKLAYAQPEIGVNKLGGDAITYMGLSQSKKWTKIETFGGKLAENATQAIARDLLAHAMRTLRHCAIVMSVHDELVIEADPRMSVDVLCEQMSRVPDWAAGLPLRAAGYETKFYLKD